jgi:hypothetical protein
VEVARARTAGEVVAAEQAASERARQQFDDTLAIALVPSPRLSERLC